VQNRPVRFNIQFHVVRHTNSVPFPIISLSHGVMSSHKITTSVHHPYLCCFNIVFISRSSSTSLLSNRGVRDLSLVSNRILRKRSSWFYPSKLTHVYNTPTTECIVKVTSNTQRLEF